MEFCFCLSGQEIRFVTSEDAVDGFRRPLGKILAALFKPTVIIRPFEMCRVPTFTKMVERIVGVEKISIGPELGDHIQSQSLLVDLEIPGKSLYPAYDLSTQDQWDEGIGES